MSKEHNNWPVLPVSATYDLMRELRRGLKLHNYHVVNKAGDHKAVVVLNYITADGKVHQVAETEILL